MTERTHPRDATGRWHGIAAGGLLWGFAEATLFFIVPDVLVGYLALRSARRAAIALLAVVAGAVLGAAVLYAAVAWGGANVDGAMRALPGVRPTDLDATRSALETRGLVAALDGIVAGQPVKLYVDGWAQLQGALPPLLVFVALNRGLRVGFTAVVCALLGLLGRRIVAEQARVVAALYASFWIAFYAWYWLLRP